MNNTTIQKLNIAKNIVIIGTEAFKGCTNLTHIFLPDSIQNIYSGIEKELLETNFYSEEDQQIIDTIMNKGELKNIKIDINEK